MEELPVATARPRHFLGRLAAARGAAGRWVRAKVRIFIDGRFAPLVLTGVFFSGMMLAMGYVADHAQRAADAIDEAHRAAARERQEEMERLQRRPLPGPPRAADADDDTPDLATTRRPAALFYIGPDTTGR